LSSELIFEYDYELFLIQNFMLEDTKRHVFYIILTAIILIQFFLLLFNGDSFVGADNLFHFQIARYSFKHPELFLDLSGNPVYSTLLAPFTLIGYNTAKAFNLIVAVLTLAISAKLSDKLFKGSSNYTIILTAFSPVYFLLMITCHSEVLFSLLTIAAVYLFYRNKFISSAILTSFIPFICFEGVLLIPFFAIGYMLKRNYRPILFLSLGIVFYTLIGFFAFGDWLWILHKFPSNSEKFIFENGSLSHLIKNISFNFGVPLLVLIVLGLIYWLFQNILDFSFKKDEFVLFFLISGSWVVYFVFQCYLLWTGIERSSGFIHHFGAIIPLAALTAVKGIQFISDKIKDKRISSVILSLLTIAQVFLLFNTCDLPTKASPTAELIKKSTKYIQQADLTGKIFYFDREIIFQLGIDPYDQSKCCFGINDKSQPSNSMEWGDLLIWDANYGPKNGDVQLKNIEKDPSLKKMESYYLPEEMRGIDGYDYNIQIYKKSILNDTVIISNNYTRVLSFDSIVNTRVIEVDGFKAWKLDSSQDYGPTIFLSPDVVKRYETIELEVTLNYKALQPLNKNEVLLVFSAENDAKSLHYECTDLVFSGSEWEQSQLNIKTPANIQASKMLAYIWNKDKKQVLMKSLIVKVKSY
jgi:hypothetical protein